LPCRLSTGGSARVKPTDLVQGTLDLLILRSLAFEPMHGWGIAQRMRQVSKEVLQVSQVRCIPHCIASSNRAGFAPSGRIGKQSPRRILFGLHRRRNPRLPALRNHHPVCGPGYGQGTVLTQCRKRHRHQEYLDFLRAIDKNVPTELAVHIIVDNYATHKHARVKRWLAERPRFLYTSHPPTPPG
jgi:hypothetical protein